MRQDSNTPILILDVGNTNIKWGLLRQNQWQQKGQLPTQEHQSLKDIIQQHDITQALGASVAGDEINQQIETVSQIRWIKSGEPQDLITSPYNMSHLGPDRWAGLLGAQCLQGEGTGIVVQAGTATTVDALVGNQHLGGFILPGLTMMKQALKSGTAKLQLTDGSFNPFPQNTPDAISTGALMATLGAIQQMEQHLKQMGHDNINCILSGGGATTIQPLIGLPSSIENDLVLEGIRILAVSN